MEPPKRAPQDTPTLEQVAIAFADAESRLKQSEFYTGLPSIPSVNELRYAGCHLLRYECPDIPQADELQEPQHHNQDATELKRALDHCVRAKYDAVAFDAHGAVKWLDLFKEDYSLILHEETSGLQDALRSAEDARRTMAFCRVNPNQREAYAAALDQSCALLRHAEDTLEALKPQLNARRDKQKRELEEKQRQERVARFRWIVGLIVTAIFSATAIGIVKMVLDSKSPSHTHSGAYLASPPNR